MRDPDRVFRDVMRYMEAKIPAPGTFSTQAELQQYLEDADEELSSAKGEDRRISAFALQELIGSRAAKDRISRIKGKQQRLTTLQRQAVRHEVQRGTRTRAIDESRTAKGKRLLGINNASFEKWRKNPNRVDLRGIDTRTHSFIRQFIRDRSIKWKKRNLRVINDRDVHVFVVRKDKNNRLYTLNILNGQRVPKKVYEKFGTLKSLNEKR